MELTVETPTKNELGLETWTRDQRALARSLGISIEVWMQSLDAAASRKTGLMAAVVGAATGRGMGLSVLGRLDPSALAAQAGALLDPDPPRVADPVLAEAIRRADELNSSEGKGALRLKANRRKSLKAPRRETGPERASDQTATADAPGDDG